MILSPLQLNPNWRVRCYIDGSPYEVVSFPRLDLNLSSWFDAKPSTCIVELVDIPTDDIAYKILDVQVSVDGGTSWYPYFYGFAMPKEISIFGFSRKVTGTDILYLLDQSPTSEIVWQGDTYLDAVNDILTAAGIPSSSINLPTSLSDIIARDEIIYTVSTDENLSDVMRELLSFGRYVLYTDASGTIRMRKYSTVPENSATIKFSTDDVQDDEYGIATKHFGREVGTLDAIVKRVIVSNNNAEVAVEATWETSSSKAANGKTVSISNKFAVSSAQCLELATDYGQDECRNAYSSTFVCGLDTELVPGLCIEIKSAANDFSTFTPARVTKTNSNSDGTMTLTVSTNPRAIGSGDDGGEGLTEDGYDAVSNPIADFSFTIEKEGDLYGIILQSTSTSDSSEISSYSWAISGAGVGYPTPTLGTSERETTVIDTLSGVSITLEITDANANNGSITKVINAETLDIYTRQLQGVADGKWRVLLDYDSGWFDITPSGYTAVVVPRYSDTQYLFAGMSDGTIWRYDIENSGVDPILVASLSGTPTDIAQGEAFISEDSANCVLVAHGTSVSVSYDALDDAPNWTTYNLSETTTTVGVNPYNPAILFVCAGNGLFVSYDSGALWTKEIEGESGSTAVDFCSFPWYPGTAVLFSGYADIANAILPAQANWGAISPTGTLQSITPGLQEELLKVASSDGEIFLVAGDGTVSQTHDGSTLADTKRIVRDGYFNEIMWLADSSSFSIGKQVGDSGLFSLLSGTTAATSVGYGQLISIKETPTKPVRAFVIWLGRSGAWVYRNETWSNITATIQASSYMWFHSVSIDNADPQKVIAFGTTGWSYETIANVGFIYNTGIGYFVLGKNATTTSPWFYSGDGGASWKELRVAVPSGWGGGNPRVATYGNGCFIRDGKLYAIMSDGSTNTNSYIIYAGEITYNAVDDVYEVADEHVYGPYSTTSTTNNYIVAYTYAGDGTYGPDIAWVSRGFGSEYKAGYVQATDYDAETGIYTLTMNARTTSSQEVTTYKKLSLIGDGIVFETTTNRLEYLCTDYTSGGYTAVDIISPTSALTLAMSAANKNGVLYATQGVYTSTPNYARYALSPYSSGSNLTIVGQKAWYGAANNWQDGNDGRYIVLSALSSSSSFAGIAIYDADKDEWTNAALDAGMLNQYMSLSAIAIGAE